MAKYQRPDGGYAGASGLVNRTKYQDDASATPKRAISSSKMDGDLNYLVDAVNETWTTLTTAGFASALPDQGGHAGQVPVTNGTATAWQLLGNASVQDKALSLGKLAVVNPQSVVGADNDGVVAALALGSGLAVQSGSLVNTQAFPPTGMMAPYAGMTAPSGWLFCGGQAVSRVTYAALFALVGTTYGAGDGTTTFAVPDLRGRLALGLDNLGGTAAGRLSVASTLGASGGSQTKSGNTDGHALTVTEMPAHHHQTGYTVAYGTTTSQAWSNGIRNDTSMVTGDTGGGAAHSHTLTGLDILPPYLLLNWIIKV